MLGGFFGGITLICVCRANSRRNAATLFAAAASSVGDCVLAAPDSGAPSSILDQEFAVAVRLADRDVSGRSAPVGATPRLATPKL
jgi:hypothetical protein